MRIETPILQSFTDNISQTNSGKYWVIADIHGQAKTFQALIEDKIQLNSKDTLFLLGDYIDRGKDSKGVIDYIHSLKKKGYQVTTIRGNHEDVLLRCYEQAQALVPQVGFYRLEDSWLHYGGKATLKSFGAIEVKDIPAFYIDFLKKTEYYKIVDQYLLVHAGLNFQIENPLSDKLSMMWTKNFESIPEKIGYRTILRGHVPVSLQTIEKQIDSNASVIYLDNGCYETKKTGMGNLVAFELKSRQLLVQKNVEEQITVSLQKVRQLAS